MYTPDVLTCSLSLVAGSRLSLAKDIRCIPAPGNNSLFFIVLFMLMTMMAVVMMMPRWKRISDATCSQKHSLFSTLCAPIVL